MSGSAMQTYKVIHSPMKSMAIVISNSWFNGYNTWRSMLALVRRFFECCCKIMKSSVVSFLNSFAHISVLSIVHKTRSIFLPYWLRSSPKCALLMALLTLVALDAFSPLEENDVVSWGSDTRQAFNQCTYSTIVISVPPSKISNSAANRR